MTEEQAQTAADTQNAVLTAATITDQEFKIFESFDSDYNSSWGIVDVPTKYDAQYTAATFEQKVAFGRVGGPVVRSVGVGSPFVAAFDTAAALDPVLGPYLGL